jgi:hypothetical protein
MPTKTSIASAGLFALGFALFAAAPAEALSTCVSCLSTMGTVVAIHRSAVSVTVYRPSHALGTVTALAQRPCVTTLLPAVRTAAVGLTPIARIAGGQLAAPKFSFERDLESYVDYARCGRNGFDSTTLHISDGFE